MPQLPQAIGQRLAGALALLVGRVAISRTIRAIESVGQMISQLVNYHVCALYMYVPAGTRTCTKMTTLPVMVRSLSSATTKSSLRRCHARVQHKWMRGVCVCVCVCVCVSVLVSHSRSACASSRPWTTHTASVRDSTQT